MRYRLCLLLVALLARVEGVEIQPAPTFAPVLKLPDGQQPAAIQSARYELTVRGMFAETSATYVFSNPNPRQLPGDLEFPLPDGATVCGYALDVGGQLVDGVVVGKDQARMILETESRVRRDPGLVEQVRGNLFRTRIFPLPSMGTRTVRISWTAELDRNGQGAAVRLLLPRIRLPALDVHLDVGDVVGDPVLSGLGNLHLTTWQDRRVADCHLTDIQPGDDLTVDLPTMPAVLTMVEDNAGEAFVAVASVPAGVHAGGTAALPAPPRIAIAWDAGIARTPEGIAQAQAALLALMKRWPQTVFDVVAFRDVPGPAAACSTPAELSAHLAQLAYDGGTSLAALDLTRAHLPNPQDAGWILVSDGMGVVGEGLPACGDVPVTVLASEAVQDAAALGLIARASGGQVVDARAVPAEAAASLIACPAAHLLRVDADPGVISEVQITHRADCDLVLARLGRDGVLRLVSGVNGADTHAIEVPVRASAAVPGSVVARAWAGAQASVLASDPLANHDRLLALGQRYGVVTANTSLLVLERLDQYLQYRVEPPATWPAMRQAYLAALKGSLDRSNGQRLAYRDGLAQRWQERVAWWRAAQIQPMPPPPPAGVYGAPPVRLAAIAPASTTAAVPAAPAALGTAPAASTPPAPVAAGIPQAVPERNATEVATVSAIDAVGEADKLEPQDHRTSAEPARSRAIEQSVVAQEGSQGAIAASGAGSASGSAGLSDQRPVRQLDLPMAGGMHGAMGGAIGGAMPEATTGSIAISPFQPDAPYLREIAAADQANAYATYLRLRGGSRSSPSFYLDCANVFLRREPRLGHRILSNLLGLRIEDPGLLRIVAWRLCEAGDLNQAIAILRHVLLLRPEEPQSYRDLSSALVQRAEASHRAQDLEEAMGLLVRVVQFEPMQPPDLATAAIWRRWTRCPDHYLNTLDQLNRDIARAQQGGFDRPCAIPEIDARLRQNLDCDLRVVMGWDQDQTDIDLHVIEPSGEEAFYAHRQTASGGLVSQDNTIGYGPEEYVLHHAAGGSYRVACQYFASHTLTLFGPATVTATVYLDWGRPTERRQMLTLRIDRPGENVAVGAVEVKAAGAYDRSTASGEPGAQISREQLAALQVGAKRSAVEAALGAPTRVDQDGVTILLYRLTNGEAVRLGFGPDLLWARELQGGAERDLLH